MRRYNGRFGSHSLMHPSGFVAAAEQYTSNSWKRMLFYAGVQGKHQSIKLHDKPCGERKAVRTPEAKRRLTIATLDCMTESSFPHAAGYAMQAPAPAAKKRPALASIDAAAQRMPAAGGAAKPAAGGAGGKGGGKSIEQIYQKKTQLEHILLRPDSYSEYRPHAELHSWRARLVFVDS